MFEESVARGNVQVVEKSVVKSVEWLECGGCSVVSCARGAFDERKNVRFVLVDEGGCGVVGLCVEDGFEFRSGFAECFVDRVVHGEFWVK